MRRWAAAALLFSGCVCTTPAKQLTYPCTSDADCVSGFVCFQDVCTLAGLADAGNDAGVPGCDGGPQVQGDPLNCGMCGNVCPSPENAVPACDAGQCTRGPCKPGFYDLGPPLTHGCEAACTNTQCVIDGGVYPITAAPLPESGPVFQTLASGSSYGGLVQTNSVFTNTGILGEPTPPAVNNAVQETNSQYTNVGGFSSSLRSP